jgi:hypothetical protein
MNNQQNPGIIIFKNQVCEVAANYGSIELQIPDFRPGTPKSEFKLACTKRWLGHPENQKTEY